MVLATAVPNQKAATKLKKAAQTTARNGVRTRVDTTVAMELAASCQPLENSKVRVTVMTTRRRVKLLTGQALLRMTHSMTLATSSHLSTAVAITSKISFHLMLWLGYFSSAKSCAMSVRQWRPLALS